MNGAPDMGGMHGFGPVIPEPNEPVFHADWEKPAFALNMAIGVPGLWNSRRLPLRPREPAAAAISQLSYYGLWVVTLENLMLDARPHHAEETRGRTRAGARSKARNTGHRGGGEHGALRLAL